MPLKVDMAPSGRERKTERERKRERERTRERERERERERIFKIIPILSNLIFYVYSLAVEVNINYITQM